MKIGSSRIQSIGKNCIDCKERYVGCHNECELYLSAKKEYDEKIEMIRKQKDKEWAGIKRPKKSKK